MRKVAYLGPKASFSELAVRGMFPHADYNPYETIPMVIDAVVAQEVEFGIVPLENALEGSVNLTLDYLIHEQNLPIVGEIVVPIEQHLLVHPTQRATWQRVHTVMSHPHAIAQCHKFLHQTLTHAAQTFTTSTSAAAQYVAAHPDECIAAIGNARAIEEYGLVVAERNVHDYADNFTRFVVLHREGVVPQVAAVEGYRTTLLITLPLDNQSGSLHQVLSAFAWRKLNLTKIESRPMKTKLGHYFFIIDIDGAVDDVLIPGAIQELTALGCSVKVLGSYPYIVLPSEVCNGEKII